MAVLPCTAIAAGAPERFVQGSTLISEAWPAIELTLADGFIFVGKVDFEIPGLATGERWVFVVPGSDGRIERMFIAHFEAIHTEATFNYSFAGAREIGGLKVRENPYAYSNASARASNPDHESARTMDLLRSHGFRPTDVWLMHRYVTVPDPDRKHEMILFYVEMFDGELSALYRDDRMTDEWRDRADRLKAAADASFGITPR